jgi:hypothetical protein
MLHSLHPLRFVAFEFRKRRERTAKFASHLTLKVCPATEENIRTFEQALCRCCILTPCSSERVRHFGGEHTISVFPPASDGFFLGLLFDPEDRGDILLRNDWLSPNYNSGDRTGDPLRTVCCSSSLSSDLPLLLQTSKQSSITLQENCPAFLWIEIYQMYFGLNMR